MTIHIESLTFDAIIGLLDFEREHTQRVVIDLQADYPYSDSDFIDYAELCDLLTAKVREARYELLEDALLELETLIRSAYPQITSLFLKIAKPDIIKNVTVALSHHWDY
ncbi:MAG: FolB domain-containing protein [Sulfurovum sp.]|nr:FolB domain-containing protein [Sulfurovum sp.]